MWGGWNGEKAKRVDPRYAVNISMRHGDLAKAVAHFSKLRVRDRTGLLGTIEIGQGTFGWKSAVPDKRISEVSSLTSSSSHEGRFGRRAVMILRLFEKMASTKVRSFSARP